MSLRLLARFVMVAYLSDLRIRKFSTMKFALIATAAVAALSASANAGIVTYHITGFGSGSLAGSSFSSPFDFTLIGNTLNEQNGGFYVEIDPLVSATYTISLGTGSFLIPTRLGIAGSTVFFSRSASIGGADLFDFNVTPPADFFSTFGPIPGGAVFALEQFIDVSTSGGLLTFGSASGVQISAAVADAPGVPEPTTWAMMVVGFGIVGFAARRRSGVVAA